MRFKPHLNKGRFRFVAANVLGGFLEAVGRARELVETPPEQLSPPERAARAGVRQFCRGVAASPLGHAGFGGAGVATAYVCDPYYNEPGNDPGEPFPPPAYQGGQCPIQYGYTFTIDYAGGFPPVDASDPDGGPNSYGPLGNPVLRDLGNSWQYVVPSRSSAGEPAEIGSPAFGKAFAGPPDSHQVSFSPTPLGGQADDCGDPPPPPPVPPTVTDPYNWGDPEVTPDGWPVHTDEPGPDGDININIGPISAPITFGDGGGTSPPEENPDPVEGDPIPPSPTSPMGGGSLPEPPEGYEWIGVRWELAGLPTGAGQWSGNPLNPNYVETMAIVRLQYVSDSVANSWLGSPVRVFAATGEVMRVAPAFRVVGLQTWSRFPGTLTIIPVAGKLA
jgi:hypothetical protein